MQPIRSVLNPAESYPQKEKEAKRKNYRQKTIDYREGSTQMTDVNPIDKSRSMLSEDAKKLAKARLNAEIDEYLKSLVMEGLIAMDYWTWHAKCIHQLGLQAYNHFAIEARSADKPQHLLAFRLKGQLQLQAKKQFYN